MSMGSFIYFIEQVRNTFLSNCRRSKTKTISYKQGNIETYGHDVLMFASESGVRQQECYSFFKYFRIYK